MPDLGKAYVQIVPSAEGITDEISGIVLPEAESAGEEAGTQMGAKLATALKAALVAAGIGAVIKKSIDSVGDLAEYGDNIDKMSQKMGMSAESYQEWDAVMQHSGTSMEAMKSSMKTLANAAETNSSAFEQLGISQEELASLNQEQLFERTISALQNVDDETQRTYLAGKTLGRGATELGALLNTSAEDTQAMRDRVHELGGVMSDDAVKAAAAYQDSLQDMKTAMSGLGRGILMNFLPAFTQIMDGIAEVFSGDAESGVGMILQGIQGIGSAIASAVPQLLETGAKIVAGIVQGIVEHLPDMFTGGSDALQSTLDGITARLPEMLDKGVELIKNIADGILQNLPTIITAIGDILASLITFIMQNMPLFLEKGIELIMYIGNGISQNMPYIITAIANVLLQLIQTIIRNFPQFLQKGIQLIANVARGLLSNQGAATGAARTVLQAALSAILGFVGRMLSAGITLVGNVARGIASGVGRMISAAGSAARSAMSSFTSVNWWSVGSNIISGIVSGITGAAYRLYSSLKNLASNALSAAKSALGIGSPSKVFRDEVGKWIPEGISEGIKAIDTPTVEIEKKLTGMVSAADAKLSKASFDMPSATVSSAGGNMVFNIYPSAGMDEERLANLVARKVNNQIRSKGAVYA